LRERIMRIESGDETVAVIEETIAKLEQLLVAA
jgi:hypothetical protein